MKWYDYLPMVFIGSVAFLSLIFGYLMTHISAVFGWTWIITTVVCLAAAAHHAYDTIIGPRQ